MNCLQIHDDLEKEEYEFSGSGNYGDDEDNHPSKSDKTQFGKSKVDVAHNVPNHIKPETDEEESSGDSHLDHDDTNIDEDDEDTYTDLTHSNLRPDKKHDADLYLEPGPPDTSLTDSEDSQFYFFIIFLCFLILLLSFLLVFRYLLKKYLFHVFILLGNFSLETFNEKSKRI